MRKTSVNLTLLVNKLGFKVAWDVENNKSNLYVYKNNELIYVVSPDHELVDREEFEAWARMKAEEIRKATSQPTKVNEVTSIAK